MGGSQGRDGQHRLESVIGDSIVDSATAHFAAAAQLAPFDNPHELQRANLGHASASIEGLIAEPPATDSSTAQPRVDACSSPSAARPSTGPAEIRKRAKDSPSWSLGTYPRRKFWGLTWMQWLVAACVLCVLVPTAVILYSHLIPPEKVRNMYMPFMTRWIPLLALLSMRYAQFATTVCSWHHSTDAPNGLS